MRRFLTIFVAVVLVFSCTTVAFAADDDLEILPPNGYSKGDVNMDRKVDVKDVVLALRHTIGIKKLTDEQCSLADIDSNGKVNIADAIYIQRIILNIPIPVEPTKPPSEYVEEDKPIELPFVPAN